MAGKSVANAKYLGGGSFGKAFDTCFSDGSHIVVKLLRAKDMLEKEVNDIKLLQSCCSVTMPEIVLSRAADAAIPVDCYGMERLGGKPAFTDLGLLLAKKADKLAFADEVVQALHSIHECKSAKFGDTANPIYDTWVDCYKPFAAQVLERAEELHAAGQLADKIVFAMRSAWEKFDIIFSENVEEACLVHGDLNTMNILVDKNHRISGFIDPLNSMYADREYDLFQFNNLNGKRFSLCDTYRQKYGESKFCESKLAFYGLWNEVFCYIKSGVLIGFIMNPLVKNLNRKAAEL